MALNLKPARWVVAVALVPAAAALPLDGLFQTESAAHVMGYVGADSAHEFVEWWVASDADLGPSDGPVYASPRSTIKIIETRSPETGTPADEFLEAAHNILSLAAPRDDFESNDTRIHFVELHPLDRIEFRSLDYFDALREARVSGTCDVWPARWAPPGSSAGMGQQTPHFPAPPASVIAHCDARESHGAGPGKAYFAGPTLRIRDSNGVDRVVETGAFDEPSQTLPPPYRDRVWRTVEVTSSLSGARLDLNHTARVTLASPVLLMGGSLTTPVPASGRLDWGEWTSEGDLEAVEAHGTFDARSPNGHDLVVTGDTTNGPHALAAVDAEPVPPVWVAGVAVAAGATGVWLARGRLSGLMGVVVTLFSRLRSNRLLDHPTRSSVIEAVRETPGVSAAELSRLLGLRYTCVEYHLAVLRHEGLLRMVRRGWRKSYFMKDQPRMPETGAPSCLQNERTRVLVDSLRSNPRQSQVELAQTMGITQARVSQMLRDLRREGLLDVVGGPGRRAYLVRAQTAPVPALTYAPG